jgi:hypothetical protein
MGRMLALIVGGGSWQVSQLISENPADAEVRRGRVRAPRLPRNLRSDPPNFGSKAFLRKLELTEADAQSVTWTPDLIRRGVAVYAKFAQEPPDRFLEAVQIDLEAWVEELTRTVRRLETEVNAVVRLLDNKIARKQAAKLLPTDGRDERIAKYERHLHTLLTSTLHELERLQARREGELVPPPAVADVNVTVDIGPG